MIFHLVATSNCWLFHPHGEEPIAWYCTPEGGSILRAAGWRPFEMPCVSYFVHSLLIASGDLRVLYDISKPKVSKLRWVEIEGTNWSDHPDSSRGLNYDSRLLLPQRIEGEADTDPKAMEQL